jgi:hypothetical protein
MANWDGAFPIYVTETPTLENGWDGAFPVWVRYSPPPPPTVYHFVAEILIGNDVVYQSYDNLPQQDMSIDVTHYTGSLPIRFRIRRFI